MIKGFVDRIKATKKLANERNVHQWYNCVLNGLFIIFAVSLILSLHTISYFINLEIGENELSSLFVILPILYSITLSYLLLEKIVILEIYLFEKFNKFLFKSWQRFDMWYYRKYRKTSPLTEYLTKIQMKLGNKMSKRKRKLIILSLIAGLIILNLSVRVPIILDSVENETEVETENDFVETEPKEEEGMKIKVHGG